MNEHRIRFYDEMKKNLDKSISKDQKYVKLLPRDLSKWEGNKYKGELDKSQQF